MVPEIVDLDGRITALEAAAALVSKVQATGQDIRRTTKSWGGKGTNQVLSQMRNMED